MARHEPITEEVAKLIVKGVKTGNFAEASEYANIRVIRSFDDWAKTILEMTLDFPLVLVYSEDIPDEDLEKINEIKRSVV